MFHLSGNALKHVAFDGGLWNHNFMQRNILSTVVDCLFVLFLFVLFLIFLWGVFMFLFSGGFS